MVTTRSLWGTSDSKDRISVVLPAPVPPTTSMFAGSGGCTAQRSSDSICSVIVPDASSFSSDASSMR